MDSLVRCAATIALVLGGWTVSGCAGANQRQTDEVMVQMHAERDHCDNQEPRGSARCWLELAVRESSEGDAWFELDRMWQILKEHGLTLADIGVSQEDVRSVERRGHLSEAKRAYRLMLELVKRGEVASTVGRLHDHLAEGNLPPQAIEPGLTFETIRAWERMGDLNEARKQLNFARERPHTHAARAAVARIRRLLERSRLELQDLEEGLTWEELDKLR